MRRARRSTVLLSGALLAGFLLPDLATPAAEVGSRERVDFSDAERRRMARLSPLPPPPADPTNGVADDPAAARLGQWLFFDPRLSSNGAVSCATCHDPARGFADGKPVAETLARGTRRTPTVVNAAYHRWLFWDGRADSLWAQALQPIENPIEMGSDRLAVAHLVHGDPALHEAYRRLFGALPPLADARRFPPHARPVPDDDGHPQQRAWAAMDAADRTAVDALYANLGKAVAAYERRLVRGDAPFDRFVASLAAGGDGGQALSPAAQRGLRLFLGRGRCTLCHSGPNLSDSEFHNTQAPAGAHGDPDDPGRYRGVLAVQADPFNAAGPHSDEPEGAAASRVRRLRPSSESWGEFRTPSLRNLGRGGPLMHAGSFADVRAVLRFYSTLEGAAGRSHHQERVLEPLGLGEAELTDLEAFLAEGLEGGPLPPELLTAPPSPLLE